MAKPADTIASRKLPLDPASPPITIATKERLPRSSTSSSVLPFVEGVHLVGQGGFARVFGFTTNIFGTLHDKCALKIVKPKDDLVVSCLLREREILRHLTGVPGMVRMLGSFKVNDAYCFAMPKYMCTLRDIIHPVHGIPDDVPYLRIVAEILDSIRLLHSLGVFHGDLKPENIFLDADYHVYLGDFGLALIFDPSIRPVWQGIRGTLEYMSFEMLNGLSYGVEADYWSVANVFVEITCGVVSICACVRPVFLAYEHI